MSSSKSNKVYPYSPRSKDYADDTQKDTNVTPRTRANKINGSNLDEFFSPDNSASSSRSRRNSLDNDGSAPPPQRTPPVRKHKSSIDVSSLKKQNSKNNLLYQSPRLQNDSIANTNSGSKLNTPRERDLVSPRPHPLMRSNSRKNGSSKNLNHGRSSKKRNGVTFRVPLEDRYPYEVTNDISMLSGNATDHSLGEEDFKKVVGGGGGGVAVPQTKAEIRAEIKRMNKKRSRKHKQGVWPTIVRSCACTIS